MHSICKPLLKSKYEDKKQTLYTVIAIISVLLPERSAVQAQNAAALHLRHLINHVTKASPEQLIAAKPIQLCRTYNCTAAINPIVSYHIPTQSYLVEFTLIISYYEKYFKSFFNFLREINWFSVIYHTRISKSRP